MKKGNGRVQCFEVPLRLVLEGGPKENRSHFAAEGGGGLALLKKRHPNLRFTASWQSSPRFRGWATGRSLSESGSFAQGSQQPRPKGSALFGSESSAWSGTKWQLHVCSGGHATDKGLQLYEAKLHHCWNMMCAFIKPLVL